MRIKMQPTSVIKARLGLAPNGRVQKVFTSTCAKAMDKYVPKDVGNLRKYRIEGNLIIYGDFAESYAQYQYYGVRQDGTHKVQNYTTPGTGPYWDKRMWSAEKDKVIKQTQNYIERGA